MDKQANHPSDKRKLSAVNQQLKAANQQLQASEQQLKATNQQLQASEQQLKAANQQLEASMFDGTINAIAVYEAVDNGNDFVFRNFNPSAERMEKAKRGDLLGKSVLEVLPRVKEFGLFDVLQRVCKTGKAEHYSETMSLSCLPMRLLRFTRTSPNANERKSYWRRNTVCCVP